MPPIPIHKNAPIAAKPSGTTPQTASSQDNQDTPQPPPTRTLPASVPATTTQSTSFDSPPAPQPGARPAAPTGTTQHAHSGLGDATPQPPQAGAVPVPVSGPGPTATIHTTETRLSAPPAQFSHPPPSDAMLAGKSTSTTAATSTAPKGPGPTTLNYGLAASPFQSADSATGQQQPQRTSLEHPPGYVQAADNAPYTAGGGIGEMKAPGGSEGEGVGAAAWNMLSKAGEALKKGEEAAWRAVRNK